MYQIYRIVIKNKTQNNKSYRFQKKEFACDERKTFQIFITSNAGIEQKCENIPQEIKNEQRNQSKSEFIKLPSKNMDI